MAPFVDGGMWVRQRRAASAGVAGEPLGFLRDRRDNRFLLVDYLFRRVHHASVARPIDMPLLPCHGVLYRLDTLGVDGEFEWVVAHHPALGIADAIDDLILFCFG